MTTCQRSMRVISFTLLSQVFPSLGLNRRPAKVVAHRPMNSVAFSVPEGGSRLSNKDDSSDERRKPCKQPWYYHNGEIWQPLSTERIGTSFVNEQTEKLSELRLVTWNIDMSQPGETIRMKSAIDYLKIFLDNRPETTAELPSVIFLQEMCEEDLGLLKESKWVQQTFHMTDVIGEHWSDPYYGTTTLVDKHLKISDVFRVHYRSEYGRDGLFVDISIGQENKLLRLCNTHLESLVSSPALRPEQIILAAKHLHAEDVYAGVVAGDLNAIQPFDQALHEKNDLKDAFLDLGGKEGQDKGFTWGYQSDKSTMRRYGPCRMDKILFCGKVTAKNLERIGVGAKVMKSKREELKGLTDGQDWITDHYGLTATLVIL